jgi:hypothetical protein
VGGWSDTELLDLWERGQSHSPGQRALALLALAAQDLPTEVLGQWSVGRRDAALLALRRDLFGPELRGRTDCPACGEWLELTIPVADLRAPAPAAPEGLDLHQDGCSVRFRLPNAMDLARVEPGGDASVNRRRLAERCVISAGATAASDLPEAVVSAMAERMAEADPQADVRLALNCPGCGHEWQVLFDIASFLWAEIQALARRLLREVHELASVYHWNEADILAMAPRRRQAYLELMR